MIARKVKILTMVMMIVFISLSSSPTILGISVSCTFTSPGFEAGTVVVSNPYPINESWHNISRNELNITVSNELGQEMTVYFYWQNNGTLIGSDESVSNNTVASVSTSGEYERYETYQWNATVIATNYNNKTQLWWFKGEAYDWDIDRSRDVDVLDASYLTGHYGETGEPGWNRADIIKDGEVNVLDASALTGHYGESY